MTPGQGVAPRRTRESTSRVRTGCSTCKTRRLKCDEAKPTCRRCTISGRNCEYVAPQTASLARKVITVYLPPTRNQPTFFMNHYGLDFFQHKVAASLNGQFDSNFWSTFVLQLSGSEPSIRHAVSAFSIVHQDIELSLRHPAGYVNANPDAQRKWNRALKTISNRIELQPNSSLVPLVCCLLFTCTELLKGNVEASKLHIQNGFNILVGTRYHSDAASSSGSNPSYDDLGAIESQIVPMFSRLNVLCSLAGEDTPSIYDSVAEDTPQRDLPDSRRRLYGISDNCIRFIGEANLKSAALQFDLDNLIEQHKLQTRLDVWRHQLHELIERKKASGTPVNRNASNILVLHYKVIYIWLRVCTTTGESAMDAYHADFEELVQCAEQVVQSSIGRAAPQSLSFDMDILGPLYHTALKCRHPIIRRRALHLLQSAPRREGLWNAHHAYVTAKRVIELEEMQLNEQGLPNESSRLHGLPLPDDESRIYSLDKSHSDHNIVLSPTCPGMVRVVFHSKPWGPLGEWQAVEEYIKL